MILAANDDERDDINIVRLDEAVYSSLKLEIQAASGIQYDDDTAADKKFEALTSSFFLDIPNFLLNRRKVVHYNYLLCFLIAWLRGVVRIILCSQQICKFIYCYAI